MTLRGDDRAVAVQIGAVILLGFLMISLSLYQATVVPNENREVEFQHNQRVQSDMLEVRNAILGTAATGSASPAAVELGTQYPTRAVAINPSPPSGTLSTSSLGTVQVRNAVADDAATTEPDYPETADFWNGTTQNYTTKSLEYRPSYANYDNAPTTVYENGLVYNRFRSGNVTRSGQPVVAGTRISLVALSGNLSRGGTSSLVVDPEAVSVSTRTISVTNESAGENVSVVVPSELDADAWQGLLSESGDYDPAADPSNGAYVYEVRNHSTGVELYFESGATYQLKLSKVGVGRGVGGTGPAYLTSTEDLTENPFVDRTYPFVVEARDKYNNPIGTDVTAAAERGTVPDGTVVEPGRYRYRYIAPGTTGTDTVRVTYRTGSGDPVYDTGSASFDGSLVENVQYDPDVQAGGGGGGGSGGGNGRLSLVDRSGQTYRNNVNSMQFVIENRGTASATIEEIRLSDPSNTDITKVYENNNNQGSTRNDVFVDVRDDDESTLNPEDGYYDPGDGNNDVWSIDTTGELNDEAQLSSSETARFYIYEFYSGGGSSTSQKSDISGENINVTLTYTQDGTRYVDTYEVTVTDAT